MARRWAKGRWLGLVAAATLGGTVFQLGSCDPAVRTTLLTGLETTSTSLADTIIQAFFVSLQDEDTSTTQLVTP